MFRFGAALLFALALPAAADTLHAAAKAGDTATIAALLTAGADPHARDNNGSTPLHFAAAFGHHAAIAALLAAAAR